MYCKCKFHLSIVFRKTVDIVNISLLFREKRYDLNLFFYRRKPGYFPEMYL